MAIIYDRQKRIFTLHTAHTTYQMQADRYGNLLHLYYGPKTMGTMEKSISYADRGFSGNPYEAGNDRTYSLDALPQEYPTLGTGDFRGYALSITDDKGHEGIALHYVNHTVTKGKYHLTGLPAVYAQDNEAETLCITLRDPYVQAEVLLYYGVLEKEDIITRSVIVKNTGKKTITVNRLLSACLDLTHGDYDVIRFYGRHAMERNLERVPLGHGTFRIGSRRGTSSHQYNPGVILAEPATTEDAGGCYGMLFVYSGNFLCEAEKDQFNQTRFTMGLSEELFSYSLEEGESITAPEVVLSYSAQGLTQLSRQYHSCILNHICKGKYVHQNRPVLINSWEAAYFDFTGDTIVNLAKQASELGIDMVVMDDGWFGKRNDDNSSLGDWTVNEEKLGGSLTELIERVNACGVKFGIWIEPEMISEDSELYRKHPDWALTIEGRRPVRSRNQLLLDFSRKEVRDEVFRQICGVLDQGNIEYVKWDMNRSMTDVYAPDVTYDYVLGLYEFLEKLTKRYPDILIEGCSGGGGRFDAGMLYYTPQIWCSDNTDAINRTRIQYGTSFFYPAAVVGSHVSAVPNHQTGRVTNMHTRGVTAMAGTFGYELDPAKLDAEEKAQIKKQLATYRMYQELIREGDYYRLSNPFTDAYSAWMSVSEKKDRALVSAVRLNAEGNPLPLWVRLKGLDPDGLYLEENSGEVYGGAALMQNGLLLPQAKEEYEAYQFSLKKMDEAKKLYDAIVRRMQSSKADGSAENPDNRIVVSLFGGSGSGKSTMAECLQHLFFADGLSSYVLGGDNYPRRIPKRNDEERERIYKEQGEPGLAAYLGSNEELEFTRLNEVLRVFHRGDNSIEIKHMGREDGDIWYEMVDFRGVSVLILEWTHGGSNDLTGVDIPVYLDSSPEETKARRIRRGRDENAASDFIQLVVALEQKKLLRQAEHAAITLGKDGQIYESETNA